MLICVHPWFQTALGPFALARRGLAPRAKMAAPARHDYAPYDRLATKTGLSIALVDAVPELKLAALALGIDIV